MSGQIDALSRTPVSSFIKEIALPLIVSQPIRYRPADAKRLADLLSAEVQSIAAASRE
ncbi:MAG: hypothetical protein QF805_06435 [Pirellulaceae bacterium]|nr:hypothetical protein [Pirellulaceae bacterium]